jgi:hypothetical protein
MRSEVHHAIDSLERRSQLASIGDVALDQFESLRETPVPIHEAVVDDRFIARALQRTSRMTADITCPTNYQDCQWIETSFPYLNNSSI